MKISVITVCFNSEETIESSICSVLAQIGIEIEYLIIDGGSTDSTLQIIEKYRNSISHIESEPDEGLYYALNKGIGLASGDIVGILHSDDFYPSHDILSNVEKAFIESGADAVYGDLQYVRRFSPDKIFRNWVSGFYKDGLFLKGWMPPHPAFFVRKECYKKYGVFNTAFVSAADYELMLRFIHKYKVTIHYLPKVLVKMRAGGKSNLTLGSRLRANREDAKAWEINNLKPAWYTFILKPLSKVFQFFN